MSFLSRIFAKKTTIDPSKATRKPVVLMVLDGFGIAPPSEGNAIAKAKTPNINRLQEMFTHTELIAAGESVGLPANEVGNSEVGHLILGAGRVVLQSLKKINQSITDGDFFANEAFVETVNHVKKNGSKLHLIGLVGLGGKVHASIDHFYELLAFCHLQKVEKVYLHLIMDGRDSPPQQALQVLEEIRAKIAEYSVGTIASVCGRFFAMDRDLRWERIEQTYNALVLGEGFTAVSAEDAVQQALARNETDEFIQPTVVVQDGAPVGLIDDNDGVIFFNYRVDRPRQLTASFVIEDFERVKEFEVHREQQHGPTRREAVETKTFKRKKVLKNLFFTTMTEYHKSLPVSAVAFPPENVTNSLPEVLASKGLTHLHLAESEKERMVTIYFNGLHEVGFPGEEKIIVPSLKVPRYDKKPEMSAYGIRDRLMEALALDAYDFVVLNFANPDMVAHTGNLQATIKAVEVIDEVVGTIVEAVLKLNGVAVITADHGNAEELLTYNKESFFFTSKPGDRNTDHSNSPVPLYVIGNQFMQSGEWQLKKGALADVAPTILQIMGIDIPTEMTGRALLEKKPVAEPVLNPNTSQT